MRDSTMTQGVLAVALAGLAVSGCSFKRMGMERMADAISATATTYARDNDPEFVRHAAPATLKMVEMLLDDQPSHPGLLLTACSGFTQYAYAFRQVDAELATDAAAARELWARAGRMYDRARDYCLRTLDVSMPGVRAALLAGDTVPLARFERADVPALYWTAAAWGGSIASASVPLLRVAELRPVRALMERALALDPAWEAGAIHEGMIALEGLPAIAGGSPARAKLHFDRAVALSEGQSALAYVAMATSVAQPANDRAGFERLLQSALGVDVDTRPSLRLANLIAKKRAKALLGKAEQLFSPTGR
jgi:hypothetical protein